MTTSQTSIQEILTKLGIQPENPAYSNGQEWAKLGNRTTKSIHSPINDEPIATVELANAQDYEVVIQKAQEAFKIWQKVPAPKRGEIVRQIGDILNGKRF